MSRALPPVQTGGFLEEAKKSSGWLAGLRTAIHRHPELGHEEFETAALVERTLAELGVPSRRMAGTGVVALVEGASPGACVGLRADMDALPIQDAKTGDVRSLIPGVMHACGHDAHTACLLGAARLLAANKKFFSGSVKLLFQPAEESDGGALPMIQEGAMDAPRVEAMFGLHTDPSCETGRVRVADGCVHAASDGFDIVIKGGGGHGAYPHTAADVLYTACMCVNALQSVVSRSVPPLEPAVVTVGELHAGTARNIIPTRAALSGTIRTLSPETRGLVIRRVREIVDGVCRANGADFEFSLIPGYPMLINDPAVTALVRETAAAMLGAENVGQAAPSLGVEDFAYFAERIPSCFFNLGVRSEAKGIVHPLHAALYDADPDALPIGAALMASAAAAFLSKKK